MEADLRQSLREDRLSDCRSFGSNFHPSSQSRKISIGVMIDSLANRKSGAINEDGDQPNTERIKPRLGNFTDGKNKEEADTTSKGKQTEDTEQVKSPWITPRYLHKKTLAPETASFPEKTSDPRQKKFNAVKDVPLTYSVQFFPNQNFNAQNVSSKQNKFDDPINGLANRRKGRKDGNSERVEDFNFTNERKVLESERVESEHKARKTENIQTETLKMKLQELFRTVSSPQSLQSTLQSHEVSANNLKQGRSADHIRDAVPKSRQKSDIIEIGPDNHDKTVNRPVTRSLTLKQAPAKVQLVNTKIGVSSKQRHQESIFSFGEGKSTKLDGAVNSGSLLSRKKKIQNRSSKIDPHKICFSEEDSADEVKQTTNRSESPLPEEKTSILGNKIESLPGFFSEKRRENFEKVQEKDTIHSPLTNETNQEGNLENPTSPGKGDKQEDYGNISLRNFVHTQEDFQSPTFGFQTPILNTTSSLTLKTVEIEQGACSPVPSERGFTIGNIGSFRTFQTSRPFCDKSNVEAKSPEDAEKHTYASLRNPMLAKEKIDAVNEYSESSSPASEERWSENFEEGSPIIKRYNCHQENLISPETVISEKSNFVHRPIKLFRNKDDRLSEFSPTSPSQKGAGIGESCWFQEPSEQDPEDELTRAVKLFALALETFKHKMDSATRKKSSEILMSISEEIKSMLLNAESQIESDVRKLTGLRKTKRKRLETRLQEQQEQLKLILEKFKEDIHCHLSDCTSILEGMEAHQNELKEIMKKQKVSHQKLLMHVEEAAEIQLNNAERRITAVHESAREKDGPAEKCNS